MKGVIFCAENYELRLEQAAIYELLHTGNKPIGTYTGDGSATARNIDIGGIGSIVLIIGNGFSTLVTPNGSIAFDATSGNLLGIKREEIMFAAGILTIASTNARFNADGINYTYQVL